MNQLNEIVVTLRPVTVALKLLSIPYYVGGSVASSYHGAVRSTMDVDIVCQMKQDQVGSFASQFGSDFYLSEVAMRQAVVRRSCFNIIHFETSLKVDIFICRERPFDQSCMSRAQLATLGGDNEFIVVPVVTIEDSIVSKLEWYRLTDETSERQWDDVTRLVKLAASRLDLPYLRGAAQTVGVSDLLSRLLGH